MEFVVQMKRKNISNDSSRSNNIIPFVPTSNPDKTNGFNVVRLHESSSIKSEKMNRVLEKRIQLSNIQTA